MPTWVTGSANNRWTHRPVRVQMLDAAIDELRRGTALRLAFHMGLPVLCFRYIGTVLATVLILALPLRRLHWISTLVHLWVIVAPRDNRLRRRRVPKIRT